MRVKIALLLGLLVFLGSSIPAAAEELYVQVRSAKLRSSPAHWAGGVAPLNYGDKLTVLENKDGWLKARNTGGKEGYIHSSATSKKKIVVSAKGSTGVQADSSDVVLAGKGFSKEVEKQYAAKGSGMNYGAVDRMERLVIGDGELAAFMKAGKLSQQG